MAAADTSCSVRRTERRNGDDAILETVARIASKLASEEGAEAAAVIESLRELQRVHMTFEALEATKIGRAVNALRKNAPSEQARQLAAALFKRWKALVDERFRSSSTPPSPPPPPPPPKAGKGTEECSCSSSLLPVEAKQSACPDGDCDNMAPTSVVVEATPGTKLHLHEEFGSATIVKNPSSIRVRVVNTNASGKAEQPQRRVTVVRRTATTPELAPALKTATKKTGGPISNNQQTNCAANRHRTTNAAAKRVSLTAFPKPVVSSSGACKRKAEDAVVSSSGACKRKAEDATVFNEARLARARARLQERYNEIEAAKQKRKIKEIKAIDAQRMEKKARQRPVQRLRCTPAHRRTGSGKQAPVPCPPRMPKAF